MSASRAAGQPVTLARTMSIADGLLTLRPGEITFEHVQAFVDDVVTVDDEAIAEGVRWLFESVKLVAEPSGAATVAAVRRSKQPATGVVAIISGGNVTPEQFATLIQKAGTAAAPAT